MTKNIYWTLSANIKDNKLEALKVFLDEVLVKTKTETGCLNYEFWFSADNRKIYIFERYLDSESCINHIKNVSEDLPTFFKCVDLDPVVILGNATISLKEKFASMDVSYTHFFKGYTA